MAILIEWQILACFTNAHGSYKQHSFSAGLRLGRHLFLTHSVAQCFLSVSWNTIYFLWILLKSFCILNFFGVVLLQKKQSCRSSFPMSFPHNQPSSFRGSYKEVSSVRGLQRETSNLILGRGCLKATPARMLMDSCIWDTRIVPSGKITLDLKCELQMRQIMKRTWKRQLCFKPIPQE